jgi:methyl-accepting chemotaxis protein
MLNNVTIKARLFLLISIMSILAVLLSAMGLYGMKHANNGLQTVYLNRTLPLADLAEIKTRLLHNRTAVVTSFTFPEEMAGQHKKIEENVDVIITLWEAFMATNLTPEEQILTDKFMAAQKPFAAALRRTIGMQKQGNIEEGRKFYFETVRSLFKPISESVDSLIALQKSIAKQEYDNAQNRFNTILIVSIVSLAVGLLLAIGLGLLIVRQIISSISLAQKVSKAIANGDLSSAIDTNSNDELGVMLNDMKIMQNVLISFVKAQEFMSEKHNNGWISERIDTSKFQGTFSDIAKNLNEMVAGHIAVKMRVVDVLDQYGKGDFSADMESLPNEKAKVSNAVVNLKTNLLGINNEISLIVTACEKGDFSKRADISNFDFMFKSMLTDLNNLVKTCEGAFDDTLRLSNALAQGDLTQKITTNYPDGTFNNVKDALNVSIENLQSLIGQIKNTSDVIASASNEISSGNNDLSHRTQEQAASLQQTAASMEELSTAVQQNTDNAKQANQLAEGASTTAKKGVEVVNEVVKTMATINESSHKIVDIITVIDDIAFQTNILALNAAVEAARAGDSGKGFAVVAVEVRNLAQRAANAAGEIKRLIDDSVEDISSGSKQVAQAGRTMEDIVGAIQDVTVIMSEISAASIEQNSGIDQVHHAITQMDSVTQQNAALVEEAAASAESLSDQTRNLAVEMSHFKTR